MKITEKQRTKSDWQSEVYLILSKLKGKRIIWILWMKHFFLLFFNISMRARVEYEYFYKMFMLKHVKYFFQVKFWMHGFYL